MTKIDFEALGLRHGDRIWIQEANGSCNWGEYLDEYNIDAQTFVYGVNRGRGLRSLVDLATVITVER